jgi:hypothetical protein
MLANIFTSVRAVKRCSSQRPAIAAFFAPMVRWPAHPSKSSAAAAISWKLGDELNGVIEVSRFKDLMDRRADPKSRSPDKRPTSLLTRVEVSRAANHYTFSVLRNRTQF